MSSNQLRSIDIENILKKETDFLIDQVNRLEDMLKKIITDSQREQFRNSDSQKEQFGNSQIRNLLNAARKASGTKEMVLFIEYQMGRDKKKNSWAKEHNGNTLGGSVIQVLKEIEQRVTEKYVSDRDPIQKNELVVRLMERFFLYWSWKYKYLSNEWKDKNRQARRDRKRKANR